MTITEAKSIQKDYTYALVIACCAVLWHLPALVLTPSVNHDEIMLNSAARSWTAKGIIALPPLADAGETYASSYYWHPPGHLVTMALAYRLFGFSIEVTRGVSLASGGSAAFLLFLFLRKHDIGRQNALITTCLFLGHPLVWWLCRSGRMDLIAISFGLAALLVIANEKPNESSVQRPILAGLLIGFGSLFHVMTLVWAPSLAAAECFRAKQFRWKRTVLIGLAAGVPLILWVASVFWVGDHDAWMEQFVGYQLGQRTGNTHFGGQLFGELKRIFTQVRLTPAWLLPVIAALISRPVSLHRNWWWAVGGVSMAFLLIALGTSKDTGAYPLYWYVWMLLLVGHGFESLRPKFKWAVFSIAAANVVILHFAQVGVAIYQRAARSPDHVGEFFSKQIPSGSIVMGPEDIWYALEKSGSELRIWTPENSLRHDYYVTYANVPSKQPEGFELLAELPDTMPKVFGHYWTHTSCSYRIWVRKTHHDGSSR